MPPPLWLLPSCPRALYLLQGLCTCWNVPPDLHRLSPSPQSDLVLMSLLREPALMPKTELPHPASPNLPSLGTLSALHSSSVLALILVFLCPASPQTEPRTALDL